MVKAIDKLLFERRLMRNLEKFVGGRDYGNDLRLLERTICPCHIFPFHILVVLERFNTTAGNPIKEILLKLNLPDHRSILMDSMEYIKKDVEVPGSSRLIRFIDTCSYSTDIYKDIKKAQETDTQEKEKNKAKNDKTKHKMEKIKKDKVIRSRKVKSQSPRSTKVNPKKVKINLGNVKVNLGNGKVSPNKAEAEK
nr:hypothetical protein [Tanacetum cinerariifolium]